MLKKNIQKCVEETVDATKDDNISLLFYYIEEVKKRQKIILKEMHLNMEKHDCKHCLRKYNKCIL